MAEFTRYTLPYTTDTDRKIFIQIVYFDDVAISPEDRLSEGGFDPEDNSNCGGVTTRRALKPRKVTVKIDGQNNDPPSLLDIICTDKDTFQQLIDNPDTPSDGVVVSYEGEKSSICN